MKHLHPVKALTVRRKKSNLLGEDTFALSKDDAKANFAGIFYKVYSGDAAAVMLGAVLSPFASDLKLPSAPKRGASNEEKSNYRRGRDFQKMATADMEKANVHNMTRLRKTSDGFEVDVPVISSANAGWLTNYLSLVFNASTEKVEELVATINSTGLEFGVSDIIGSDTLTQEQKVLFSACCLGGFFETSGTHFTGFLRFKINKQEAEAITGQEFLTIRPTDLYPALVLWRQANFLRKAYAKSTIAISRIAETLPRVDRTQIRTDRFGISVDAKGQPLYVPEAADNAASYEDKFFDAGNQGSYFSLMAVPGVPAKLPANIPVLVDWVNNKFSYTNTAGNITVADLSHNRKCDASGAINILKRLKVDKQGVSFLTRLASLCAFQPAEYHPDVSMPAALPGVTSTLHDRTLFEVCGLAQDYTPETKNRDEILAYSYVQFLKNIGRSCIKHIDAVYQGYGVSTISHNLGWILLVGNYGADLAGTEATKNKETASARNQKEDNNWQPPKIPLIGKRLTAEGGGGMLPHQAKVRSLLKDAPRNAVLSVAAGGGKSMLSITDILYFIEAGFTGPFLIMCPSFLVPNYVTEVVEFTDGKMNVIPFTSYNIRTTGFERYEDILNKAPRNTVLIVDYDVLKYRSRTTSYGTAAVAVAPVVDLIRRFEPQYVMMDESHFLKNANSSRARSVLGLIADIPYKRIASGTLNPDSPSDLPGQMALLDPTVLGSRDEFNQRYGDKVSGDRVLTWKTSGDDSLYALMGRIKEDVVWAEAKRKEWACALPPRADRFLGAQFTDNQRLVYDALFDDMVQTIRKQAEANATTAAMLEKLTSTGNEDEDMTDDEGDLGPALQPFIADLERFVTNPASHPYAVNGFVTHDGKRIAALTGADLISPKINKVREILEDHFANETGKVIIFANYDASVDAIFDSMPPELQASGIRYKASSKVVDVAKFKTDPSAKWMIGIRKSLETGLNLQVASRLIRVEGVWTPGEQEQGDSRIERPDFRKGGDKRSQLFFDTIVVDQTIDITKAARLRAKQLALAKFENASDERYRNIPDIPLLPMKLDIIRTMNSFATNLGAYENSIRQLSDITKKENAAWRAKIEAAGGFKLTPFKSAGNPEDAALMSRVPYAQGTELYSADESGWIRVDHFLGLEMSADTTGDTSDSDGATTDLGDVLRAQRDSITGLRAHCEFGDGYLVGATFKLNTGLLWMVGVQLDDGTTVIELHPTAVFVQTRTETSSKDLRNLIAKATGLSKTADIEVPGVNVRLTRVTKKQLQEAAKAEAKKRKAAKERAETTKVKVAVPLTLSIMNGYMRLSYDEGDKKTMKVLQGFGFRTEIPYVFTRIKNAKHLLAQARAWHNAGFIISDGVTNDAFRTLVEELESNGLKTAKHYTKVTSDVGFNNFLRTGLKPTANKKDIRAFALVNDALTGASAKRARNQGLDPNFGAAYLCLPTGAGYPATTAAVRSNLAVTGTRWVKSSGGTVSIFVENRQAAQKVFTQLKEAGIEIGNKDELQMMAKQLRTLKTKKDVVDVFEN